MKLNDIVATPGANKDRKRVGRGHGSGHVKTAGRGTKGQKSRTGGNVPARFQGGQTPIQQQLPYKRGFTNIWSIRYNIVNLEQLTGLEKGADVTPDTLLASGILRDPEKPLKVLGDGELNVALTVSAHKVSEGARQKIEAAGGTVNIIETPNEPKRAKGRTEAPVRAMKARQAAK
ncbi:MAG: 50S ribosomal protein L15 [Chloroflexia bacterium]